MGDAESRPAGTGTAWRIAAVLVVLAGILAGVILWLRGELRQRIVNRDLAAFHQIVKSTIREAEERYLLEGAVFLLEGDPLVDPDTAVPVHLVEALLDTLNLENVVSIVLFDREGFLQDAFPENTGEGLISDSILKSLAKGDPRGFLDPAALELTLPILLEDVEEDVFLGVVRYFLEPGPIQVELEGLDHQLLLTGVVLLLTGGGVVVWILVLAFRRLECANRLLEERGLRLASANQQLLLAAKTSAVGSLTANLVHGLKNPLSGLQEFVRGLQDTAGDRDGEEVQLAMESARRMQDLIQDTLDIIKDSETGEALTFSLAELWSILHQKLEPLSLRHQVRLCLEDTPEAEVGSMRGNLLVLVLFNLGQNAVEASAVGQEVEISCRREAESFLFRIQDAGPGLPASMREDPFHPVRSSKTGGSGIGLALSRQLAGQMEGRLELESTSAKGTTFLLTVPAS